MHIEEKSTERPLIAQHPLQSTSEFGKLRSVVVGTALGANHPVTETSFAHFFTLKSGHSNRQASEGPVPAHIVDEIEEDISIFVSKLQEHGIEVLRPEPHDSSLRIKTPDWETDQLYSLMPRDCIFVHGKLFLEVPSPTRSRYFETLPFRKISAAYELHPCRRSLVISAPKPRLLESSFAPDTPAFLPDTEVMFDAANCVRLGKDIFMDINNSANMRGRDWLQHLFDELGWGVRVHAMHLGEDHADVTLVPLRPGVILIDPKRVNDSNLPEQFGNWSRVVVSDLPNQGFGLSYPMASNGIGRNVLMLDENTAVVEQNQLGLIRELERFEIDVIPLRYRHGRTLGGSWHCITLDTNRDGGFDDYFRLG